MSEVIEKLRRARSMAWADLVPAFDHAIVLAEEAEATAERAANEVQVSTSPAYPALVMKLAESIRDEPAQPINFCGKRFAPYGHNTYTCAKRENHKGGCDE